MAEPLDLRALELASYAIRDFTEDRAFPISVNALAAAISTYLDHVANTTCTIGDLALDKLSPMERRVAEMLRAGIRVSDIARQLHISHHTARNHLKHVFRKLGVHSQVELLALIGGRR
jgi:DNA-binding CsgD family transcriptional regulator